PQVDRLVLSCIMQIDHRGEIVGYELCEGIIRSAHRMTYTDVNAILEGDAPLRKRSEEHTSELQSPCNLVCRLLLEKKKKKKNKLFSPTELSVLHKLLNTVYSLTLATIHI